MYFFRIFIAWKTHSPTWETPAGHHRTVSLHSSSIFLICFDSSFDLIIGVLEDSHLIFPPRPFISFIFLCTLKELYFCCSNAVFRTDTALLLPYTSSSQSCFSPYTSAVLPCTFSPPTWVSEFLLPSPFSFGFPQT